MNIHDIDFRDRRIIITASKEMKQQIEETIDWKKVLFGELPLASTIFVRGLYLLFQSPFYIPFLYFLSLFPFISKKMPKKALPYPVFDLNDVRDIFDFPPQHPVDGQVYACCDLSPQIYVPLSSFHKYMYEKKMSAFRKLCANLGVHYCRILYAEDNGVDITGKLDISNVPTNFGPASSGIKINKKSSSAESAKVYFEFPFLGKPMTVTNDGWIVGEPTWSDMQQARLENKIKKYKAEFSYSDDMGINGDVAAKLSSIGLKIGGNYEEIHKRKWIFDVEFWDNI